MQTSLKTLISDAVRNSDETREQWKESECLSFAKDRFYIEGYSHYCEHRLGLLKACTQWFQGLAFNVPEWNSEIESLVFDSETYWKDLAMTLLATDLDHDKAY